VKVKMMWRLKYEWKIQNCDYTIYTAASLAFGLALPYQPEPEPTLFPPQRLKNLAWKERPVWQKRRGKGRR
jgi:hypothetical protein